MKIKSLVIAAGLFLASVAPSSATLADFGFGFSGAFGGNVGGLIENVDDTVAGSPASKITVYGIYGTYSFAGPSCARNAFTVVSGAISLGDLSCDVFAVESTVSGYTPLLAEISGSTFALTPPFGSLYIWTESGASSDCPGGVCYADVISSGGVYISPAMVPVPPASVHLLTGLAMVFGWKKRQQA